MTTTKSQLHGDSAQKLTEENKHDTCLEPKALSLSDLGSNIIEASYLIRGSVLHRAAELKKLREEGHVLPFAKFYPLHYGNPQLLGQPPITFLRQVMAVTFCPSLLDTEVFSEDVKRRVRYYLANIPGGAVGAYSEAEGFKVLRDSVAKYISKRDGHPADVNKIYLLDGALDGMTFVFRIIFSKSHNGIMLPFPEYPGYSFLTTQLKGKSVFYQQDEGEEGWSIGVKDVEDAYESAKEKGINIKAIVFINPNNPTGSVLSKEAMFEIIKFAYSHSLVIIADEVYQTNIHTPKKFTSFKKAVREIEAPFNRVELVSFHSISKGFIGECGVRGGYMEFVNFDPQVMAQIHKVRDACSVNVAGTIATEVMCNPPDYENNSKETVDLYVKERDEICSRLAIKAKMVVETLNSCKRIKCYEIEGALYSFPRIFLTQSAIDAAKEAGLEPSEYFCRQMLEQTGIITVPGSGKRDDILTHGVGFGQKPGTYHFRVSLLIWDLKEFETMMEAMKNFIETFFIDHP